MSNSSAGNAGPFYSPKAVTAAGDLTAYTRRLPGGPARRLLLLAK